MKDQLVLASGSPRRIEYFQKHGYDPLVRPSRKEEKAPEGLNPAELVQYLALSKALDIERILREEGGRQISDPAAAPGGTQFAPGAARTFLVGADTVVCTDPSFPGGERILGKPKDAADAVAMLKELRGRSHRVLTGVAILEPGTGNRRVFAEETKVFFGDYTDEEILAYVASKEPMDKAGAYAIQGGWGKHVSHFDGDYDNVIGLPWERTRRTLEDMGFRD
ncbi:MAG: septum formation protein Maf [Firmicutes bacterium]|nr:septum formation protein Maf [Bacillota bacterium]